jgi:hypothetical protein
VLLLERADGSRVVVKDYAPRPAWVRALLAPLLVRRELGLLERVRGVPGVPAPLGRIDALALAMEYLDGLPLRRRTHGARLAPGFFDELERILAALAERGLVYLDLRSPTNVLELASGRPALVDLASAFRLPVSRPLRSWLERRALAKLRRRFARAAAPWAGGAPLLTLKIAGTRISYREAGPLRDPVPVLCLHDLGLTSAVFAELLAAAPEHGRRVLAPDLPGFGDSRREVSSLEPSRIAGPLERWLDALRVERADVVGQGWGARIARAMEPGRVRRVIALRGVAAPAAWPAEAEQLRRPRRSVRRSAGHPVEKDVSSPADRRTGRHDSPCRSPLPPRRDPSGRRFLTHRQVLLGPASSLCLL